MSTINEPELSTTTDLSEHENPTDCSHSSSGVYYETTETCEMPAMCSPDEKELEINGKEILLKGEGQQAFSKTPNSCLVLRIRNDASTIVTKATGIIAYSEQECFDLNVGFSTVSVPIKITNFNKSLLTVTNTSRATIGVRLNGRSCEGKQLENGETITLLPNEVATSGCEPSDSTRKLSLTTQGNSIGTLIVYGTQKDDLPILLGLNCDPDESDKENYAYPLGWNGSNDGTTVDVQEKEMSSYPLNWRYNQAVPDNKITLDVQPFTIVTVINISPTTQIDVLLYNTTR